MKRKVIALALLAACGVLGVLLWPDPSSKAVLPDGTVLVLSGLKIGRTNVYQHGTRLSKLLGRFAPSNAVKVAGLKLERPQIYAVPAPEGLEILTAELWLRSGSPREKAFVSPPFYPKHRLLIFGDEPDGFTLVKELNGFKPQPEGLLSFILALSYPSDSARLHFRLEERETSDSRDWREVATFVVNNPKRVLPELWKPQNAPRIKLADELEVEVGELAARHEPIKSNDIWEHTAFFPVRVFRNGALATNWGIQGGTIRDANGNYDSFSYGFTKTVTNGWTLYRLHRPLDPAKVWKLHLHFARDSDYPATNLFSFTVPWPMPAAIQTNFAGSPVRIYLSTAGLDVELTNKPAQMRVTFIQAVDDEGTNLDSGSGSWSQHRFWKMLNGTPRSTGKPVQVHATLAIHENYEAEFMVQPRDESKSKP